MPGAPPAAPAAAVPAAVPAPTHLSFRASKRSSSGQRCRCLAIGSLASLAEGRGQRAQLHCRALVVHVAHALHALCSQIGGGHGECSGQLGTEQLDNQMSVTVTGSCSVGPGSRIREQRSAAPAPAPAPHHSIHAGACTTRLWMPQHVAQQSRIAGAPRCSHHRGGQPSGLSRNPIPAQASRQGGSAIHGWLGSDPWHTELSHVSNCDTGSRTSGENLDTRCSRGVPSSADAERVALGACKTWNYPPEHGWKPIIVRGWPISTRQH